MLRFITLSSFALSVIGAFGVAQGAEASKGPLDFTVTSIDGKPVELSGYRGKVILMVNVASKCGLTPQYEGLEAAYQKYRDQGFVILGFPANEFGRQEPGTNDEIAQFCSSKYSVDFPMFAKIVVKGEGISPLYEYLTSSETDPKFSGPIQWNFEKFLIGRDGRVVARFDPKTKPDAPEVVKALEAELAKK